MAAVSVFVDDSIRGELPAVCVKTGEPAELFVRSSHAVGGGLGLFWLLVLLGPPGWLGLVLLSFAVPGQERLTVRLPYSQAAWDHERRVRGVRLSLFGLAAVGLVLAILHPGPFPLLWLATEAVLLVAGCAYWAVAYLREMGVYLDASRRWVTLTRVHPDFARAAERQEAAASHR
jgi:hypothetical protein